MHAVAARDGISTAGRSAFLDTVRAVALARVILWHTYGHPAITVALAAMPAMFFVSGSLYARSRERRATGPVLWRRLRRILIPLWLFVYVAFAHQALIDRLVVGHATFEWWRPLQWALPVTTPYSPHMDGAWWGTHLWYLRCFVFVLLAAPVLLWLWRRFRFAALALPVAALASFHWMPAMQSAPPEAQEFVLYSFFWMLGYAYHDGHFARLPTRGRAVSAGICAIIAVTWWAVFPPPHGLVNASHQAHLLVGLAWLFTILALEGPIGRLGATRWMQPVVHWVSSRAVTVYLWHVAAVWIAWNVAATLAHVFYPVAPASVTVLPVTVALTVVFAFMFGWLEDIAAGRRPSLWPRSLRQTLETTPPLALPADPSSTAAAPVLVQR